jgi:hypothetical protein
VFMAVNPDTDNVATPERMANTVNIVIVFIQGVRCVHQYIRLRITKLLWTSVLGETLNTITLEKGVLKKQS